MNHFKPLSVFLFLISVTAIAQAQTPTPTPKPVDHNVSGEVRKWTFSDGREMTLVSRDVGPVLMPIPFGVSSSTCSMAIKPKTVCKLGLPLKITQLQVRWTKHSDAAKIGQVVKYYTSAEAQFEDLASTYQQLHFPEANKSMPPTQMYCDDFTWLSGTKEAPAKIVMDSLNSEFMIENPETGQSENRTLSTIYSPLFEKKNAQVIEMKATGEWVLTTEELPEFALVSADVHHVVLDKDLNGNACQISLKPDLSSVMKKYDDLLKSASNEYLPFVVDPKKPDSQSKSTIDGFKDIEEAQYL